MEKSKYAMFYSYSRILYRIKGLGEGKALFLNVDLILKIFYLVNSWFLRFVKFKLVFEIRGY